MKAVYSYAVLRYIHDVAAGESMNVGLVLFSPAEKVLHSRFTRRGMRLTKAFPTFDISIFRDMMRYLDAAFDRKARHLHDLFDEHQHLHGDDLRGVLTSILPQDDTSLQWSDIRGGVSDDLPATFERLYDFYIQRFERNTADEHRDDDDVWRVWRESARSHHIERYLQPKSIRSPMTGEEIDFPGSWRNGVTNCCHPISFDLTSSDNILRKAHLTAGRIDSLRESPERLKVWFLVAAPTGHKLADAFDKAARRLTATAVPANLVREEEFSDRLAEWETEIKKSGEPVDD